MQDNYIFRMEIKKKLSCIQIPLNCVLGLKTLAVFHIVQFVALLGRASLLEERTKEI